MRKFFISVLLSLSVFQVFANHISGGEIIYEYMSPGTNPNTKLYKITLRLFRDNNGGGAQMPGNVYIGIFDNLNGSQYPGSGQFYNVPISNGTGGAPVPVVPPPICMVNPPDINYNVGYFEFEVELPNNAAGYTAAYQTCCRIFPLQNVYTQQQPAQGEGSTYICTIPGDNQLPVGNNSSPQFTTQLTRVCHGSSFSFDFSAVDPDSDSLVYYFCSAYNRGASTASNNVNPTKPPYQSVTYINGYSGNNPLGFLSSINRQTGIITGVAPASSGRYVVCVCIDEYRNGALIGHHRKDFILAVYDCDIPSAKLNPFPVTCDGFNVNFQNDGSDANVQKWYWNFGDPASGVNDTSTAAAPSHVYSDTGVFMVKFVVNRGLPCSDSTTTIVKVYPGFFPGFSWAGQCKNTPIQFTDNTTTAYGTVTPWSWDFADVGSPSNSSLLQSPTHVFATAGSYNVTLTVGNSKGCSGTIQHEVLITDQPALSLNNDTLICNLDTLQLNAVGTGSFLWTPNYMISNTGIPNPLVSPDVNTTYVVTLTDPYGCVGKDSVKVSVVSFVTLVTPPDSSICRTDPGVLRIVSDGLYYLWSPAATLNDPTIKNPIATPLTTTTYHVIANIGKCVSQGDVTLKVVPYPSANAGPDKQICYGNSVQLNATGGTLYSWNPIAFLNNSHIANPVAVNPTANVRYIVTVRDTLGCPKGVNDTVLVNVSRIIADAGPRDTSVVLGQPLQLHAGGSINYLWTPSIWLSDPNISDPIALPLDNIEYVVKVSNAIGCFANDSIRVKLYKLKADIYVPSGFSPNGDGDNDIFRPILIGMRSLDLFKVYNRWGQMLYSGTDQGAGWDGKLGGKGQDAASYVWYAEGTDYKGTKIKKKGYVVLIR
ncbi:MAG: PKD domain-containing protein [Chitinophagaceae bacterium]